MHISISPRRVTLALAIVVLFLSVASLVAQFVMFVWGHEGFLALLVTLNASEDANVPTWYSSFALLLCSILLALIAVDKRKRDDAYALHWNILSVIFLVLSVDEVATIHEKLGTEALGFTTGGLFYNSWVVYGIVFVLVVMVAYLRFLIHLPKRTRLLFLVAGVVFVAGAVGTEMLSAGLISSYGAGDWNSLPDNIKIVGALEGFLEELLEMSGVTIFIFALLSYISSLTQNMVIQVQDDNE